MHVTAGVTVGVMASVAVVAASIVTVDVTVGVTANAAVVGVARVKVVVMLLAAMASAPDVPMAVPTCAVKAVQKAV